MTSSDTPKMTLRDAFGPGYQLSGVSERTMRTAAELVARRPR